MPTEWNAAFLRPSLACVTAVALIALFVVPLAVDAQAQTIDTEPTLGIELTSTQPVHYVDEDGHTVIVGEVTNLKDFPVSDVRVWGGFYADGVAAPLETQIGSTLLGVIPPRSSSPYVIRSASANLDAVGVSVNLLGFTSSAAKPQTLSVSDPEVSASATIRVAGTLENAGDVPAQDVTVYALVYDSFVPPRLLGVHGSDLVAPVPGEPVDYAFSLEYGQEAAFVRVIAESDTYASNIAESSIMRALASPLSIRNIAAVNDNGTPVSTLREGVPTYIRSTLSGLGSAGAEYEYIVQVKRFGHLPVVEFVGSFDGVLTAAGLAQPLVEWTPRSNGLFYVEAYLWDPSGVSLARPGPLTLLNVEPRL